MWHIFKGVKLGDDNVCQRQRQRLFVSSIFTLVFFLLLHIEPSIREVTSSLLPPIHPTTPAFHRPCPTTRHLQP